LVPTAQKSENFLFRNEIADTGAWKFADVTVEAVLDVNNRRWSFAAHLGRKRRALGMFL